MVPWLLTTRQLLPTGGLRSFHQNSERRSRTSCCTVACHWSDFCSSNRSTWGTTWVVESQKFVDYWGHERLFTKLIEPYWTRICNRPMLDDFGVWRRQVAFGETVWGIKIQNLRCPETWGPNTHDELLFPNNERLFHSKTQAAEGKHKVCKKKKKTLLCWISH